VGSAARLIALVVGSRETLPEWVVAASPELAAVRWRRGGLPPRIAGWFMGRRSVAAITLWSTVFFGERVPLSLELLLHELRHVHQFQASRAFPAAYLWESVRRGYHKNRFERDACEYARTRLQTLRSIRHPGDE
jgi:hypothetical protein